MVFNFKSLLIQGNFHDPIYFLVKKMNVFLGDANMSFISLLES